MSKNFIRADYPPQVIRNAFDKVYHLDRHTLLNPTIIDDSAEEDKDNTFLITTFHPNFRECNIPYSQFLRLKRICSTQETFTHQCREMSKNFIRADYPPQVIRNAFDKVYHLDRHTLLNPTIIDDSAEEDKDNTFLITTFHPNFRECNKIVQKNWDILDKSSSTRPLIKLNLIKGNRRAKNLRDILVRARLPKAIPPKTSDMTGVTKLDSNYCNKAHCQYCSLINTSGRIKSVVTNREYNTRSKVTCPLK